MLEAFNAAVIAWVAWAILMEPGMILHWWYREVERIAERYEFIAKPLGYCGTCFAGQIGFWSYVFSGYDLSAFGLITATSYTIFFFTAINGISSWAKTKGYL